MGSILLAFAAAVATLPLLTIHRSVNANIVRYDVRVGDDGLIDADAPLDVYWLMNAEDGHREGLNWIEPPVYGAEAVVAPDRRSMRVVIRSLRARPVQVRLTDGAATAEAEIAGETALVDGVFVQCGLFSVDSVRIRGHTSAGKRVEETLR